MKIRSANKKRLARYKKDNIRKLNAIRKIKQYINTAIPDCIVVNIKIKIKLKDYIDNTYKSDSYYLRLIMKARNINRAVIYFNDVIKLRWNSLYGASCNNNPYSLKMYKDMYDRFSKVVKDFNINVITSTQIDSTKISSGIYSTDSESLTEQTNSYLSISKDPEVLDKIVRLENRKMVKLFGENNYKVDTELSFTSDESVLQVFKREVNDLDAEVVYGPSKVQVPGKLNIEIKYISINKENTNGDV